MLDIDTTISLETTWHAMEDLVSKGLARSIGIRCNKLKLILLISNFLNKFTAIGLQHKKDGSYLFDPIEPQLNPGLHS